jgi:hypothetical protein
MRNLRLIFIVCVALGIVNNSIAQTDEKIWFDGFARSYFARDAIDKNVTDDTLSARNASNGYNLLDLNTHVNPIDDIEIFAQIRIKNSFGGFFGSGTEIDSRQLRVNGTINNKVRFSVGDLFLKQSRFTLFNYDEELSEFENDMFQPYRDIIHYENFYTENRWRLQGIQTDFSFIFDRHIKNLAFDFFITRPRGSRQISIDNYSSDLLLSGGSMVSELNNHFTLKNDYINLFEVSSSGNQNISVRNPVYQTTLSHYSGNNEHYIEQKLEVGFSKRYWLHTELDNYNADSISNKTHGLFFELENSYFKKDSTFDFSLGYRYVDPDFRSAGAQTRRLDYGEGSINSIYPLYTNMQTTRPTSIFDLIADDRLYNQDLSSILLTFNPIYSNILPFGDATPNRNGVYFNGKYTNKSKIILGKLNAGFFREVIGQGTPDKRRFTLLKAALKLNIHRFLKLRKELSFSLSSENEFTKRSGNSVSSIDLKSNQLSLSLNAEFAKRFFIQANYRQFNVKGNEFLTQRNDFGEITYFSFSNFNQKDKMLSIGILNKLRENIYANIQYNWWGMEFTGQSFPDYKYNRLLFILSLKL